MTDEAPKSTAAGRTASTTGRNTTADERIVVDFIANFVAGGDGNFEPVKGRVLMSETRLVLATSSSRTVVPLDSIFDLAVGQVPPEVEQFFDFTIMVGYVVDNTRKTTVIGGDRKTIEKFSLLIFRALLNGSRTWVKHPAKVGGRVMETEPQITGLHVDDEAVLFPGADPTAGSVSDEHFGISLGTVTFFEVEERTVDGAKRLVLSVRHTHDGQTVTTEISLPSRRKMNILGRYLRLMYHAIKNDVRDVEVDEAALEALVGIYSTDGDIDLASLLDLEKAELDQQLTALHEDGLIDDDSPPCSLTPQGHFVVNEEFEEINI